MSLCTPIENRLLIDGSIVPADGGAWYDNVNPATGEVVGVAADGRRADMDRAIAAARHAFDSSAWSTDTSLRVRCLRQLHDAMARHVDEIRATMVAEVGCPIRDTYGTQLEGKPMALLPYYADVAESYDFVEDLGVAAPMGVATHRYVRRGGTGVVGAITPWNYPMQTVLAKLAPALAAGNTVVLKPAPDTPWTVAALGRLIVDETDVPPGVVNIVTSSSRELGQQLVEDHRVDMVSFTGSTAVGRNVLAASASNLKRVFLELGGKSAFVALDDADVDRVAMTASFQVTSHAGQGCAITSRLLLPRSRYQEGLDAVVAAMSKVPYGDPTDPDVRMGPLVSARQRERVLAYIRTAVDDGASIALGGGVPAHLPHGFFVEPTVLADVDQHATVAQEEVFGPVLAVIAYDDTDDDAVAVANNSRYGLSGAVMSASVERARAVAERIRTGTISVNGGIYSGADVPFGGVKESGYGREMGVAGFEEYLTMKSFAEGV